MKHVKCKFQNGSCTLVLCPVITRNSPTIGGKKLGLLSQKIASNISENDKGTSTFSCMFFSNVPDKLKSDTTDTLA